MISIPLIVSERIFNASHTLKDSGFVRWISVGASTLFFLAVPGAAQESGSGSTVTLEHGDLRVVFRDNSDSPKVLSGLQSLFHQKAAPNFDAFDPDSQGASAGLNFEHIISGHRGAHNAFTPRQGRYVLGRLSDEASPGVELVREREDSPWKVSSRLRYSLVAPEAVDFSFQCRTHEPELFGERGTAIFFFANYMNDVVDHALHFRGLASAGAEEAWIRADAPAGHHEDHRGGGTYRHRDAEPVTYDVDHNFKLNSWSYDYPRFTDPFYYGRAANDMVLILMFDRARSPSEEIRFSLFKFKLNRVPSARVGLSVCFEKPEARSDLWVQRATGLETLCEPRGLPEGIPGLAADPE